VFQSIAILSWGGRARGRYTADVDSVRAGVLISTFCGSAHGKRTARWNDRAKEPCIDVVLCRICALGRNPLKEVPVIREGRGFQANAPALRTGRSCEA
jgi:hypothetical protein